MSDEFNVASYPDEFTIVRVGDEFTVEQWPDEFIIHDNTDDWTIYTTTETEYTLEFQAVGLNDAAITIAARNAALAAQVQADADVVLTHADAAATAADRVQTGLDRVATAADRVQTGLDAAATAADRVQTGLDRTQTGLDAADTAADRVQTGLDRTQTGLDAAATAADRVQTGIDVANANTILADLVGGTTGQILIKASNADYDFGWMNPTGMLTAIYDPTNIAADVFARANHTGTQLAATISDFSTAADARVSAAIGVTVQAYSAILAATTASYTVALDTKLGGIASGADVTVSALPVAIHGAAAKAIPVDADELALSDSAAAFALKKLTWANAKEAMRVFFYQANKATPLDADLVGLLDTAALNAPKYSTWTQIKAFLKTYFDTIYTTTGAVTTQIAAYAFSVVAKTTLVGADTVNITDSAAANVDKKITWTNMLEQIRVFFMGTNKVTPVDADIVLTGDSAASFAPKYSTWTQVKAFLKTYFDTLYATVAHTHTFASLTAKPTTVSGYGITDVAFTKAFSSAQQTITAAGALTIAHGLGVKPTIVQVFLQNTTAELGYSIGDEQCMSPSDQSLVADATNVNVRYANTAYSVYHKTTGALRAITATNWKLVVRAWA